ncbi:MAG TPA: WD40 repeat domain-containing protein [Anaerolineales bacterium]|nr:WD40 repeat domain-containing protein [Anaerolineales bacterium]
MLKRTLPILVCLSMFFTALPAQADTGPIQRLGTGIPISIAVAPDGKTLAVGSSIGVWFLDAVTLLPLHFWDTGVWVNSVEYSVEGRYLKVNEMVYDAADGSPANDVTTLWLEPACAQERNLCVEAMGGHFNIVNTDTGLVITQIPDQWDANSIEAAFSPDGATIYGVVSGVIKAWDVHGQLQTQLADFFTGPLRKVAWSPNGAEVLSHNTWRPTCRLYCYYYYAPSRDGVPVHATRSIWNVATAQIVRSDECWYGDFACNRPKVTGWYDRIQARDPASGKVLHDFRPHRLGLSAVALSADGRWLATSGEESYFYRYDWERTYVGATRLWDAQTFTQQTLLPTQFYDLAFSPDGCLVVGHTEAGLAAWDWQTGQRLWIADEAIPPIKYHSYYTTYRYRRFDQGVAVSPSGELVAAYTKANTIRLYRLATGEHVATFTGHTVSVTGAAFSPDSAQLAASSYDGTVLIWPVP